MKRFRLAALAVALSSHHALADEPVRLTPASAWHLDFADTSCRLSRQFGPKESPSFLSFEQIAPGSDMTMTVAGPQIDPLGDYADLTISVRDDRKAARIFPMTSQLATYGKGFILTGLRFDPSFFTGVNYGIVVGRSEGMAIDLADAEAVSSIELTRSGRSLAFETGGMTEAVRALNACTLDLMVTWGLQADEHVGHNAVTVENEQFEIGKLRSKYARGPGRKRHEALLKIRALIEPDGSVSECVHSFTPATSDDTFDACAMVRDMRFRPANAADGTPIRSFYALAIPLSWVDPLAL